MKNAVVYARYSSDKQTEQSIEGQIHVCDSFAKSNNYNIVDYYIDRAMTGTNDNRASFQKMLKDSAKKEWDYVIVYKLDRFSRNKYETAIHKKTLRDNGVKLISAMENIPDTPEGILMESLLEGMAEYYSVELSQKVARGMRETRSKGLFPGGKVLYGYKLENRKLYANEEESKIVQDIFTAYAEGCNCKEILTSLNNKAVFHNNGKPFDRQKLYSLLRNEKYAGIYRHDNEVYTNIYPAIISEELFEIVRKKIKLRAPKDNNDVCYKLKNKLFCGYCGRPCISDSGTSRNGFIWRYYSCGKRRTLFKEHSQKCSAKSIRKEFIEKLIVNKCIEQLQSPKNLNIIIQKLLERNTGPDESQIKLLMKEKGEIEKSIDNLITAIQNGFLSEPAKDRIKDLQQKQESVNARIEEETSKVYIPLTKESILRYLSSALLKEDSLMINALIDKVILFKDKIDIYFKTTLKDETNNKENFCFNQDDYHEVLPSSKFNGSKFVYDYKLNYYI